MEWGRGGGGPAGTLSGPFLLTCLLYFMGCRLGGSLHQMVQGRRTGVTASEHGGLLYTCWTHSLDISSEQIWKGCNKQKKNQPLNGNLIVENESTSNL